MDDRNVQQRRRAHKNNGRRRAACERKKSERRRKSDGRPVVETATRFAGSGAPRSDGTAVQSQGRRCPLRWLLSCVPSSCVLQQARRGSTAVVDDDARRGTMETGCAPRVESRRQVALEEGPWRICKVQRAMCDMRWRMLRESFRRSGVRPFSVCPVGPGQRAYGRVCYGPARAGICLMCWRCLMERANCAWSLGSLVQQRAA